jgi:hypothetical protein
VLSCPYGEEVAAVAFPLISRGELAPHERRECIGRAARGDRFEYLEVEVFGRPAHMRIEFSDVEGLERLDEFVVGLLRHVELRVRPAVAHTADAEAKPEAAIQKDLSRVPLLEFNLASPRICEVVPLVGELLVQGSVEPARLDVEIVVAGHPEQQRRDARP